MIREGSNKKTQQEQQEKRDEGKTESGYKASCRQRAAPEGFNKFIKDE